jgi:hypothetical protein
MLHKPIHHGIQSLFFGSRAWFLFGFFAVVDEQKKHRLLRLNHHGHTNGSIHHVIDQGRNIFRIQGLGCSRVHNRRRSEAIWCHEPLEEGIHSRLVRRQALHLNVAMADIFDLQQSFVFTARLRVMVIVMGGTIVCG